MQNQNPSPRKRLLRHVLVLPEGVIEVILLKLAVKSLLRFRCVSRSWLSLINSDRFVKLHLKTSTQNMTLAHHRVVFNDLNGCSLPSFLKWIDDVSSSSSSSPIIVDGLTNTPATKFPHLVGFCNGVLCLLYNNYCDDENSFRLWNPATRVSVELSKFGSYLLRKIGFGWDESSGAFKVFAVGFPSHHDMEIPIKCHVYSSKTNSWKIVQMDSRRGRYSSLGAFGVFLGGRLHWVIGYHGPGLYAIESFNLENDEYGRDIDLPSEGGSGSGTGWPDNMSLGEIRGCLCSLFDYTNIRVDVWVMKEYGVKESWFKLLTFPLAAASARTTYPVIRLPGEGPNGEIPIIYGHTFSVYSPKGGQLSSIATNIGAMRRRADRAGIYVESLVSPTPTP